MHSLARAVTSAVLLACSVAAAATPSPYGTMARLDAIQARYIQWKRALPRVPTAETYQVAVEGLSQLESALDAIIRELHPDWSVAAAYLLGQANEDMAEVASKLDLSTSHPCPADVRAHDEEMCNEYFATLQERLSKAYVEAAIKAYRRGIKVPRNGGPGVAWVAKISARLEALEQFRPQL